MIRILIFLMSFSILLSSCSKDEDLNDSLSQIKCDLGLNFFEPSNKTFIFPEDAVSFDTLYAPIPLKGDFTYFLLDLEYVCTLHQNLGKVISEVQKDLCYVPNSTGLLDEYYYQYVGISSEDKEYIFINAFHESELNSLNWNRLPFIPSFNSFSDHWQALFNLSSLEFESVQVHPRYATIKYEKFPYISGRCESLLDLDPYPIQNRYFCLLEDNLYKIEELISEGCYFPGEGIRPIDRYYMQYAGGQKDGKKYIYINALHEYFASMRYTQEEMYHIPFLNYADIGKGAWGVFFDIETQEMFDLQFNYPR